MSAIVSALTKCELEENNNLVEILSVVRSSRRSETDAKLASVVRGLCTQNSALLAILKRCDQDMAHDEKEVFKTLVNDFIVWFDDALVVFERYLSCFPLPEDYEYAKFSKPVLHVGCYSAFIDSAISGLRNPFIVEKLTTFRCQIASLLDRYSEHLKLRNLDKISFDNVQAFGGNKVSCSFTVNEIVERTKNEPLFVGSAQVEMLLLNLRSSSGAPRSPGSNFNALAVLRRHGDEDPRALMFPPFRINEVAIGLSAEGLSLQAIAFFTKPSQDNITISGSSETLQRWHEKLSKILPQINNKFVPSGKLELAGLGISCSSSDDDSAASPNNNSFASFTPPSTAYSDEETKSPTEIMKKTLGDGSTSTGEVTKTMNLVQNVVPGSVEVEYCHADDVESVVSSDEEDIESSFEMVKPKQRSVSPPKATVYRNAAGSAINIHEFGKNYNPSFCSVNEVDERKPKKKFFSSLFKKNKSRESLLEKAAESVPEKPPKAQAAAKKPQEKPRESKKPGEQKKQEEKPREAKTQREPRIKKPEPSTSPEKQKKAQLVKPPPLDLSEISKSTDSSSGPSSATSSTFKSSALPSPFALPSSTSTYFFKPGTPGTESNNNSSSSLATSQSEQPLSIPASLKDIINSDNTIDFYISPTKPKVLKVSKWKRKYGKWEMLTTNENLFIKIVTNYETLKSWLLVFKEEYDEEYDEIIDKPLLIMNIDSSTQCRKSSALDLEIQATNAIDSEKILIIMRCFNGSLMNDLSKNLENIMDIMSSKSPNRTTSSESSSTLMSSLMSKPSFSSTLTNIQLEDSRESSLSPQVPVEPQHEATSDMLLLDRMTVRLHKQMESYEKIHELSSWKTLAMYTLSVFHSAGSVDNGMYHLILESQSGEPQSIQWTFGEDTVTEKMEQIGKAGLLVMPGSEMFMVECKCKSQLRRLQGLF